MIEPITDASQDASDLEFKRLAQIYNTNSETTEHRSQRTQLICEQKNDVSLRHWFSVAKTGSKVFIIRDGILWKQKEPNSISENDYLLCLPAKYSENVTHIAHERRSYVVQAHSRENQENIHFS